MGRWNLLAVSAVIVVGGALLAVYAAANGAAGQFASTTIDVGIVTSDVEKAVQFYKEALGFAEVAGFDVPADMGGGSGLTENHPFHVRVMVLGKEPTATKIKLMEFPQAPGKKVDHKFIHSSLGYSYLTIFVTDHMAAVERAKKAGAVPVKEPYRIRQGKNFLTLVRDPDGNIIELVGPMKD